MEGSSKNIPPHGRLTNVEDWDATWKNVDRYSTVNMRSYIERRKAEILKVELANGKEWKVCELGCGSGRWLKFLAENGLITKAYGLDFSQNSTRLTIENIKSVSHEQSNFFLGAIRGDLFSLPFKPQVFNFIYSMGVIEHFANWSELIKIERQCLKPGGKMLTVVPNLGGLNGAIMKRLDPAFYAEHMVIYSDELRRAYENAGLTNIEVYYLGVISLTYVNWKRFCFNSALLHSVFRNLLLVPINFIARKILKLLGLDRTRLFSPEIVAIGEYRL